MSERDRMIRDSMTDLEFRRWKMLMDKIDNVEGERRKLQEQIYKLTPKINELYLEMQMFWKRTRGEK